MIPKTKNLLYKLKEEVVKTYAGTEYRVYAFLLEKLEIYDLEDNHVLFLKEINEEEYTICFINPKGILEDIREFKGNKERVLKEVERLYGKRVKYKVRELDKLKRLIDYPLSIVITLREVELTRGGEYIELAYLVSRIKPEEIPKRVWFFKREGIPISTMVKELLTDTGIRYRSYSSENELIDEVLRIIYYSIRSSLRRLISRNQFLHY